LQAARSNFTIVQKLEYVALLILMDIEKVLTADELTSIDSMLSTET